MARSDGEPPLSKEQELERALRSDLTELPENQVKGFLGERGPDLYKEEDFTPDLNAGVSQEIDLPVVWLAILLSYLLFFPLAYVILWRTRRITLRAKVIVSVVGACGVAFVAFKLMTG